MHPIFEENSILSFILEDWYLHKPEDYDLLENYKSANKVMLLFLKDLEGDEITISLVRQLNDLEN
jgi:hypothetical protein